MVRVVRLTNSPRNRRSEGCSEITCFWVFTQRLLDVTASTRAVEQPRPQHEGGFSDDPLAARVRSEIFVALYPQTGWLTSEAWLAVLGRIDPDRLRHGSEYHLLARYDLVFQLLADPAAGDEVGHDRPTARARGTVHHQGRLI